MARLRFSLICQGTSIDYRNNDLSIFRLMDTVLVVGFPSAIQFLEHLSVWDRDEVDELHEFRIRFLSPENKLIAPPHLASLKMTKPSHRYTLTLSGFPIPMAGTYKFIIETKTKSSHWKKVSTVDLKVALKKEEK